MVGAPPSLVEIHAGAQIDRSMPSTRRSSRLAAGRHWHALDSNWLCLGMLGRWLDAP
jgi:hypothetical protein